MCNVRKRSFKFYKHNLQACFFVWNAIFLGPWDKKFTSTSPVLFCSHSILWVYGIIIRCDKENMLHFSCPGSLNLAIIITRLAHTRKKDTVSSVKSGCSEKTLFCAAISTLDLLSLALLLFSSSIDVATATNINRSRTVLNLNVMKLEISILFLYLFFVLFDRRGKN